MMLPSGNDAAQSLCENLGKVLWRRAQDKESIANDEPREMAENPSQNMFAKPKQKRIQYNKYFLQRMNSVANCLKMHNSSYCNPHGLVNKFNYSTAYDISLLVSTAFKTHPMFVSVLSTEYYFLTTEITLP